MRKSGKHLGKWGRCGLGGALGKTIGMQRNPTAKRSLKPLLAAREFGGIIKLHKDLLCRGLRDTKTSIIIPTNSSQNKDET